MPDSRIVAAFPSCARTRCAAGGRQTMDRLKLLVKNALRLLIVIAVVLVGALLTDQVGPLRAVDAFFAPKRTWWVALTGGMAVVGVLLLIGTQFVVRRPTDAEIEELSEQGVKVSFSPMTRPEIEVMRAGWLIRNASILQVWRRARYRLFGRVTGSAFAVDAPMGAIKAAFRSGAWRRNPIWQRMTIMGSGAILMALGLLTLPIILESPPLVKLLCAGALLYATARTVWAFKQA